MMRKSRCKGCGIITNIKAKLFTDMKNIYLRHLPACLGCHVLDVIIKLFCECTGFCSAGVCLYDMILKYGLTLFLPIQRFKVWDG